MFQSRSGSIVLKGTDHGKKAFALSILGLGGLMAVGFLEDGSVALGLFLKVDLLGRDMVSGCAIRSIV